MFEYQHLVQFYETDLMGIVHHSNYLRFYEEARVAWAHSQGLIEYQKPESASYFAVVETQVRHLAPLKFGELARVQVQAKLQGIRIIFEYKLYSGDRLMSEARTVHVSLDPQLKLMKPPASFKKIMEKVTWTETWLSSL